MLHKIIEISSTIAIGVMMFGVFEYLRNIKPKTNDKTKRNLNDS